MHEFSLKAGVKICYSVAPKFLEMAMQEYADAPNFAHYGDPDHIETQEWLEAFDAIVNHEGKGRAQFILKALSDFANQKGIGLRPNTAYINTISSQDEPEYAGDLAIEKRLRAIIRYNAIAMVVRANKTNDDLGGHLASFASSALLYETGFNHFWRAQNDNQLGDMIYYQGHTSPGMYARSFVEGRLSETQLANFRREIGGQGLSSYPHPYLMPDYWQFPTVSMGLGPIMSIYQAHIQRYLENRNLLPKSDRKIWAFLGDGETDEPESLGALSIASREKLDNLIWVINCNLQRLDGPVRGNGKVIQELESTFLGAGWRVIKVIWGSEWDELLAKDHTGVLKKRMAEVVDGDYQLYAARDASFIRTHFFGKYPELQAMADELSDAQIAKLGRGGHDPRKVYSAYHEAVNTKDKPTVILVKTVKGYGLSSQVQAVNKSHQIKKLDDNAMRYVRDRLAMPFDDEALAKLPFYRPDENSEEVKYLHARRQALGGYLPTRIHRHSALEIPNLDAFARVLEGSDGKEQSTTMVFARLLGILLKDKNIGKRVVPIVPDEARTFGLEGMFRQLGIYSPLGQNYVAEDADALMGYREAVDGHMLEEGINEAGAMSAWIALATSYSTNALPMIPMYIYYSMFGFQRIGDLAWAAGDSQAQGFLLGATAGRTTLNGEGLQHQDGHSHLIASTIANCVSYDPCFGYELAVIVQDGLKRMYGDGERVYYYITLMNENYAHPAMPDNCEEGIKRGLYALSNHGDDAVNLIGAGVILREVQLAAQILADEYNIKTNIFSATSFNELAREGAKIDEHNRLNGTNGKSWVAKQFENKTGICVAATDHVRAYAEQIRAYLPNPADYVVLGTDGFGRSDTRANLRAYFRVDAYNIVVAVLHKLAQKGKFDTALVAEAVQKYALDGDRAPSWQLQDYQKTQTQGVDAISVGDAGDFVMPSDETLDRENKAEDKADAGLL